MIKYNYELVSGVRQKSETERDPARVLEIQNATSFKGEERFRSNKCWVVNGVVEREDGNFLKEFFITKIEKSGVYVGSYPGQESCVRKLKEKGITAVLNL